MDFDTSYYGHLADGEDVEEEDLMGCDDDSDTESYNAGLDVADVKVEVMSDSCLLCGYSPAVSYDCEGKPIKREPPQLNYSYQHLFSTLCHLLAIRKSCQIWTKWDFGTDPFPFCEQCESLMTSLAELRQKLGTLESEIKGKLRRSEGKYVEEKLYERHSRRYYEFRKAALGEHFLGTEIKVVRRISRKVPIQTAFKTEENSINSVITLNPVKQSLSPKGNQMMKGKPPTKKSQVKIRQKKKSKTKSKTEFKPKKKPTEKTAPVETTGNSLPSFEMERVCKRASIIEVTAPSRTSAEDKKERSKQRERQAFEEKYATLVRLSEKPRSELTPAEQNRLHKRSIVRDPDTDEITLFTGSGNRFQNTRVILKFTKVEEDKMAKILKYNCNSCSETITLHRSAPREQVTEFRAHYRRSHMKVYRCKLCPKDWASTCFTNKPDLLVHLKSAHKVDSILKMNLKAWAPAKVGCHICGMPFDKRLTIQFNRHLKSHMSEEESQNFVVTKRRPKESMPTPYGESLCEICGQYGGGCGCSGCTVTDQHKEIQYNVRKEPCMCSLCGEVLAGKYGLAGHMKRVHPDGKPVGPQCKFPKCEGRSFDTELSLKEHVSEEHLESEENRRGLLCLLCGRVFASTQGKSFHKVIHTKEKRFKCNSCSKRFPLKSTLLLHEATIHREGKDVGVFRCEVGECEETFPCRKYLGDHLRKRHGIFKRKRKEENVN